MELWMSLNTNPRATKLIVIFDTVFVTKDMPISVTFFKFYQLLSAISYKTLRTNLPTWPPMSFSKILVSNVCPQLTMETAVYILFDNFFQVCSLNIEIGVQKRCVFMCLVSKLPFMNCIFQPSLIQG